MKRNILLLLAVSVLACSMCACTGNNDNNTEDKLAVKQNDDDNEDFIPAKDVVNAVKGELSDLPEMTDCGMEDDDAQDTFEYLCDVDYSLVKDYYISYSVDSEKSPAQEVFVMLLKNEEDVEAAEKALNDRVARRKSQFIQYKPEVLPVVNKAQVVKNGKYVAVIVSEDAQNGAKAFKTATQ